MKPTLPLRFSLIAEIIAQEIGASPRDIRPDTDLRGQCDSLHVQSIAVACDMAFQIEIPDDCVEAWRTPLDVARTVALLLRVREAIDRCEKVALP